MIDYNILEQFVTFYRTGTLCETAKNMLLHARDFDRKNRTITLGSCTPVYLPELIRHITAFYPTTAISSEVKNIPQLLEGVKNGIYQFVLLPVFLSRQNDTLLWN